MAIQRNHAAERLARIDAILAKAAMYKGSVVMVHAYTYPGASSMLAPLPSVSDPASSWPDIFHKRLAAVVAALRAPR
jgi:hypothetical protein